MTSRPVWVVPGVVAVAVVLVALALFGGHANFLVSAAFMGIGYLIAIGIAAFVAGWAFRKGWDLAGRS